MLWKTKSSSKPYDEIYAEGNVMFTRGGQKLNCERFFYSELTGQGAVVDIWHANALGGYSFFDPAQRPFNLRRRVKADSNGRYAFRTILPAGYACPPNGPTLEYLGALGRHGRRPAQRKKGMARQGPAF